MADRILLYISAASDLSFEQSAGRRHPRGGAGASSVILSTERFTPSEGKLVGQPKPKPGPVHKR